jgi:hypothetical protein
MSIESFPKLTPKATELYANFPTDAKKRFHFNVLCQNSQIPPLALRLLISLLYLKCASQETPQKLAEYLI